MLKISREALAGALTATNILTRKRQSIPILGNVLLEADKDVVSLQATDMDLTFTTYLQCAVGVAVKTTFPGNAAAKFLSALTCDELEISLDENKVRLNNGTVKMALPTRPLEDFPVAPSLAKHKAVKITMPCADFLTAIDSVAPAISTEERRYYLNGVYFENVKGRLRMVATDGHRMHVRDTVKADAFPPCIVPGATIRTLQKRLKKRDGEIEIAMYEAKGEVDERVVFSFGRESWESKVIDGTFPEYTRLCPNKDKLTAAVHFGAAAMSKCLSTFKKAMSGERAIRLSYEKGTLTAGMSSPDDGEVTYQLQASESGKGQFPDIGFNGKYLADTIKALASPAITLKASDPASPALFTGNLTEADMFVVLMPMRF